MGQTFDKAIMEEIVGKVVRMPEDEEANLNVSTLDTSQYTVESDQTTSIGDDATKDHAAGYTFIIKKLMDLSAETLTNSATLLDVKNMVIDLAHGVSTLTLVPHTHSHL